MSRRGFVMVMSLLLLLILLVMGLAFLGTSAQRARGATHTSVSSQALWLARAGLEDARGKLAKDLAFPPPGSVDQQVFGYSEDLLDPDGVLVGTYTVTLDRTFEGPPYQVLRVTSQGRVGRRTDPMAERVLTAELDVAQWDRADPTVPNPTLFQWLSLQDSAGF
ncbi:MAG: hypothetical protein AB1758_23985 [Candidatus Eremiobacterota bacterium]